MTAAEQPALHVEGNVGTAQDIVPERYTVALGQDAPLARPLTHHCAAGGRVAVARRARDSFMSSRLAQAVGRHSRFNQRSATTGRCSEASADPTSQRSMAISGLVSTWSMRSRPMPGRRECPTV